MLDPPRFLHDPQIPFDQPVKNPEHYNCQPYLHQANDLEKGDPTLKFLNHGLLEARVDQRYGAQDVAHDHLHI
jgi:hypothetical protein